MRTYVVESDFWDRWFDRIKKFSNVQWLSIGGAVSGFLFLFLILRMSSQRSTQVEWHLSPYETKVLPLASSLLFAKQTLVLEGNVNATKLYLASSCPEEYVMEQENKQLKVDVRHRGKQQNEFLLQTGATMEFSLTGADGDVEVHFFSDWDDEKEYERHPALAKEDAVWTGYADKEKDAHFSMRATKDDTYVFLFQGMSGQTAMAHFKVSRMSYDLTHLAESSAAAVDTKQYCSYKDCRVPLLKGKKQKCLVIESTSLSTRDMTLQINVDVNNHHWLVVLVSLVPLLASMVYIKYGKEPTLVGMPPQTMLPGYALVAGDGEQL
mmetsp:Transcript_15026/g.24862  ORF Transcript_15026/g.24862 Transcript_15026/m.24862 type:complete len:323 (-) Transcript_15026:59-1027(-)